MIVTNKKIPMDKAFVGKLDQLCDRCSQKKPKLDTVLIFDGYEGYGKTTMSIGAAYYIAWKTKRKFSHNNLFFKIEDLTKFAQDSDKQIIIWDEAALGGLASEWSSKSQINLTKLLMTIRKKRHFLIFNVPKIFKMNEYIGVERTLGLVHVYARKETQLGRFVYFNRRSKDTLYSRYKRTRIKDYKKYSFRGTFPDVLDPDKAYNILDKFDVDKYEEMKDAAIASIGKEDEKEDRKKKQIDYFKYKISTLPGIRTADKALWFDVNARTIRIWKNIELDGVNPLNKGMMVDGRGFCSKGADILGKLGRIRGKEGKIDLFTR